MNIKKLLTTITLSLTLLFAHPSTTPTFGNTTPTTILTSTTSPIQITNVQVISDNGTTQSLNISSMYASLANTTDSFTTVGEDITVYITVNDSASSSTITNVSMDCTTPNGEKTLNLVKLNAYTSDMRWVIQKYFIADDIGTWTINRVIANDDSDNTGEKSFSNFKFYVLPSNFKPYSQQPLSINNSLNTVKVSFSEEMDSNTINTESVLLFETTGMMSLTYNAIVNDYNIKQLTDCTIVVSEDKKSFTLKYNSPYEEDKQYHVIVKDNVKDLVGNSISNPMWVNFQYVAPVGD